MSAPAPAIAAGSVVAGAVLVAIVVFGAGGDRPPPAIPAPIATVRAEPAPVRRVAIPDGFLTAEGIAATPPEDREARWHRSDAPNLPALVSPCGGALPSDQAWVGGRQLVLVHPSLWKAQRLVVYRDAAAARAAMTERRAALRRCERQPNRDGTVTVWASRPLDIGDEAMFVASQRVRGRHGVPGHGRGIVVRVDRSVVFFFDMGQLSTLARPAEVAHYLRDARTMAHRLANAPWT